MDRGGINLGPGLWRWSWPLTRSRGQTKRIELSSTALVAGASAAKNLVSHAPGGHTRRGVSKPHEIWVRTKRGKGRIVEFNFRGVKRHSRLAKETIPFLLKALCGIEASLINGRLTTKLEKHESIDTIRERDPDLVCRVINHLRTSGLSEYDIVRLMNGTALAKSLLSGDLTFHGGEPVIISGTSELPLSTIQEVVEDLCFFGAYELACQVLQFDAVKNLPPEGVESLWFRGAHPLRSTGAMVTVRLKEAGVDVPVDYEEGCDREFHPLKQLLCAALCAGSNPIQAGRIVIRDLATSTSEEIRAYQWLVMGELCSRVMSVADAESLKAELTCGIEWRGTPAEPWLCELQMRGLDFESLVESSSESLVESSE
jgi:hypothetical protein